MDVFVKTFSRLLLWLTVQPPGGQRSLAMPITAYIADYCNKTDKTILMEIFDITNLDVAFG